jgi:hypothetical protein
VVRGVDKDITANGKLGKTKDTANAYLVLLLGSSIGVARARVVFALGGLEVEHYSVSADVANDGGSLEGDEAMAIPDPPQRLATSHLETSALHEARRHFSRVLIESTVAADAGGGGIASQELRKSSISPV